MVALADQKKHVTDEDLMEIAVDVCRTSVTGSRVRDNVAHEAGYGFGV